VLRKEVNSLFLAQTACRVSVGDVFLLRTIIPNFEVEFKESDKIMMQNTEKSLLKRQKCLSEKKRKKNDKNY